MLTKEIDRTLDETPGLAKAGTSAAEVVHDAVLRGGEPARNVADVLHGTWLGHPLHPVLTDVTIGSWVLGAAFDAIGAIGNDRFSQRVGDRLTAIGAASALPTALAGIADYSTIPQEAAPTATVHGVANTVSLALYLLSLRERGRGRRGRGLLFSGTAMAISTAAAWLGGDLVYSRKVGVDHAEREAGPEEWTPVLHVDDLAERRPKCVDVEGKKVLLYREDGQVSAIGAVCSHAGGPLQEGKVEGHYVECPWHQSVFDLRDGSIKHGPTTRPQPVYEARIREGRVEVRRSSTIE